MGLTDGYKCMFEDGVANDDTCIPYEVAYDSATGFGGLSVPEECAQKNPDACAREACTIEGTFVREMFLLLSSGNMTLDMSYSHNPLLNNDVFDYMTECHIGPSGPEGARCCGEVPYRFPYHGSNKDCCGQKTYNVNVMECCDDDVPRITCL